MDQLDDRASDLLNSALGCTFLVAVSETGNPIESITDPEEVLRLAAECADYVDPFGAEHSENVLWSWNTRKAAGNSLGLCWSIPTPTGGSLR